MATSNRQNQNRNQNKIPLKQVEDTIVNAMGQPDQLRAGGLAGMAQINTIKLVQTRRERGRLEAKYGSNDPRVQRLDRQIVAEHQAMVFARMERDKAAVKIPRRVDGQFILFGHVRDVDGYPLQDYQAGLYADAAGKTAPAASASTDKNGLYTMTVQAPAAASGKETVPVPADLYFLVRNPAGKLVYTDGNPMTPDSGGLVYRDVVVEEVSQAGCGCSKTRYLGNSGTRELHDLQNEKPKCELAKMRPDHRVYFASTQEAQQAGYDYCAYCIGKQQSKR